MRFKFGYDKGSMEFEINEKNLLAELLPNNVEAGITGQNEVKRAIQNPIGSNRLKDIVSQGEKVVIITSDITRPMPSKYVVPLIIEELKQGGICCKIKIPKVAS